VQRAKDDAAFREQLLADPDAFRALRFLERSVIRGRRGAERAQAYDTATIPVRDAKSGQVTDTRPVRALIQAFLAKAPADRRGLVLYPTWRGGGPSIAELASKPASRADAEWLTAERRALDEELTALRITYDWTLEKLADSDERIVKTVQASLLRMDANIAEWRRKLDENRTAIEQFIKDHPEFAPDFTQLAAPDEPPQTTLHELGTVRATLDEVESDLALARMAAEREQLRAQRASFARRIEAIEQELRAPHTVERRGQLWRDHEAIQLDLAGVREELIEVVNQESARLRQAREQLAAQEEPAWLMAQVQANEDVRSALIAEDSSLLKRLGGKLAQGPPRGVRPGRGRSAMPEERAARTRRLRGTTASTEPQPQITSTQRHYRGDRSVLQLVGRDGQVVDQVITGDPELFTAYRRVRFRDPVIINDAGDAVAAAIEWENAMGGIERAVIVKALGHVQQIVVPSIPSVGVQRIKNVGFSPGTSVASYEFQTSSDLMARTPRWQTAEINVKALHEVSGESGAEPDGVSEEDLSQLMAMLNGRFDRPGRDLRVDLVDVGETAQDVGVHFASSVRRGTVVPASQQTKTFVFEDTPEFQLDYVRIARPRGSTAAQVLAGLLRQPGLPEDVYAAAIALAQEKAPELLRDLAVILIGRVEQPAGPLKVEEVIGWIEEFAESI